MKKNILVVEDNRVTLNYIVNTLTREGHNVLSAEDGLSALGILTSFTPDIMFVDLIMPKIGGEKLCRIVRKMQHLDSCYLVVISGAIIEMELDFTLIGANACIAKGPFGKMAEHILAAVTASEKPWKTDASQAIMGIDPDETPVFARQMTRELLSRNQHLETILESIAEGILEVYSGKIVYANSTAVAIFGRSQEGLLGQKTIDLFDDTVKPRIEAFLQSEGSSVPTDDNRPVKFNDRLITIKSLPVKTDPSTTIILIRDVTLQKQLEMRLQHVMKMEAIGTIASGVAHNFRNTLAGILNNAEVLLMNYQDVPGLKEITERIEKSVKNGAQMVERLLQFSRKQIKAEFQKINLAEILKDTCRLIESSLDKQIDIHMSIEDPVIIMGEASGLSQSFMNLLTNARDAIPERGVLDITLRALEENAVVKITDNGIGMDPDTQKKCFDPFFTTKAVGKGTGLGLSTTYGIIKSHEGGITVESGLEQGTTFIISLPMTHKGI